MAKIRWTKEDVIKKFQEAVTPQLSKPGIGQRPGMINTLLEKARLRKPGGGEPQV